MNWVLWFELIAFTEASLLSNLLGIKKKDQCPKSTKPEEPGTCAIFCGDVPKKCEESKYRSYDGSCNNLEHSWWSTPLTAYERLLPNTYSDGIYEFPKSKSKKKLPNPRTCSLKLYADVPKPDPLWTVAFMQYGQLIAHDMSKVAGVAHKKTGTVSCCFEGKPTPEASTDRRCAPIKIPEDDPYNVPEGITCMHFYRTKSTKDIKCTNATKVSNPLTTVTSVLDMSFLYGSDEETAMSLRAFEGGKLKSDKRNGNEFLTQVPDPFKKCNVNSSTEACYKAGDDRVNQNPELTMLHHLHLRQHNYIADALNEMNPHWDDEKTYQEARRIAIAMFQHIVYYEYLPILIGRDNMIEKKLIYMDKNENGCINDYDPEACPAVSIEFASAANRIFHSEVIGRIELYDEDRNVDSTIQLSDWIDRPSICELGTNFNGFTRGLATQAQSAVDTYMTNDILNFFAKYLVNGVLGQDLKAIDIKRSRDHGCGTYVEALKYFKLADAKSYDDFNYIDKKNLEKLKGLYDSYQDVDLAVALTLENLVPRTLCGPVSQKILTEQMYRTRIGDRFFYENCIYPFQTDQMEVIRQATISSYLCLNPDIEQMQSRGFEIISPSNPLMKCCDLPKFNPTPWKDVAYETSE